MMSRTCQGSASASARFGSAIISFRSIYLRFQFLCSTSSLHPALPSLSNAAAMQLQEVVLCATSPTSANAGPGAISLHDMQTGASLASFKQTSAGAHCTAVSQTRGGQGGFILAAQADKSIMNVYNFQKVCYLILNSWRIH